MYLRDSVQKKIAEELLATNLSAQALADEVGHDFIMISYLAYAKAQQFEYKTAIDLVRLGAHCGTVLGVLHFNAPDMIQSCVSARDYYFEQRYLNNPSQWHMERARQKAVLEGIVSESTGERQYSDRLVEESLVEDGYGLNIVAGRA